MNENESGRCQPLSAQAFPNALFRRKKFMALIQSLMEDFVLYPKSKCIGV